MRVEENGRTRIISPADLSISPCIAWPSGPWTLDNSTFRGADVDSCRAGQGGHGSCAWQQDMSYLGNIPSAHDFFMFKSGWCPAPMCVNVCICVCVMRESVYAPMCECVYAPMYLLSDIYCSWECCTLFTDGNQPP